MFPITLPAFGETAFFDNQENRESRVILISDAAPAAFADYCALLAREGFAQKELRTAPHRSFAAWEKDGWGVFINYFAGTAELQLVVEENSAYGSYWSSCGAPCTTPRVTQVKLGDYAISDVIRLSDGRLLVIDGGNTYESDVDALWNRLTADSPFETPVIAGWIMTHAHSDHFYCFFPFMKKYGDRVKIEKFFFNFPAHDDLEHFPKLTKDGTRLALWLGVENFTGGDAIRLFREEVAKLGVPVYTPHTGQCYPIGDARLLFMGTMDDTIHRSQNINATSLMFMMELGGQKIFFGADGSCGDARLADRYGEELKADILQIPHHGFGCGSDDEQIRAYRLMAPRVCLLPASGSESYRSFCTYKEGTNFLMTRQGIEEMIVGDVEKPLDLPYTPIPEGAQELRRRYEQGREDAGARTWVFTDLDSARLEDYVFTVLNGTFLNADMSVDLYYENMQKKILHFRVTGPRRGVFRVNCAVNAGEEEVVFDEAYLAEKGVPENTPFAVRFISNIPVVISHRDHAPAYCSNLV